jgi:hypothetical protein
MELQTLAEFRAALCIFQEGTQEALASVEFEIRRAAEWLDEQKRLWQQTVRDCQEEVVQAKADLARRKMSKLFDRPPDCTEQELALRQALHRLEEAESKVESCRRWVPLLEREVEEYQGPARRLLGLVEGEVPRAMALLARMSAALEAYIDVAVPGDRASPVPRDEPGA